MGVRDPMEAWDPVGVRHLMGAWDLVGGVGPGGDDGCEVSIVSED